MKSAIALAALSFAIALWVMKSGSGDSPPLASPQPAPLEAPHDLPTDFESAVRAAAQTGSTSEGLKYQDDVEPVLSRVLQERVSSCSNGASAVGQSAFAIVLGIAADGAVTSTWASPETPLASCVLRRLAGAVLPPPPAAGAWMAANITPDAEPSR